MIYLKKNMFGIAFWQIHMMKTTDLDVIWLWPLV